MLPPSDFLGLAQQRQRHAEHRGEDAHQPEALDDLGFAPAEQLKMMVDGGHAEQALAVRQRK